MKTNFSKMLSEMLQMPGRSSTDQTAALAWRENVEAFAENRYMHIHAFSELVEVITPADRSGIEGDLAAIRQIAAALKQLETGHREDLLGGDFQISRQRVDELRRKAEREVKALLELLAPPSED
jgi:hypothetical protein